MKIMNFNCGLKRSLMCVIVALKVSLLTSVVRKQMIAHGGAEICRLQSRSFSLANQYFTNEKIMICVGNHYLRVIIMQISLEFQGAGSLFLTWWLIEVARCRHYHLKMTIARSAISKARLWCSQIMPSLNFESTWLLGSWDFTVTSQENVPFMLSQLPTAPVNQWFATSLDKLKNFRKQAALSQDCRETIRSSHFALPIGDMRMAHIRLESGPIKGQKHCEIMRPLFYILLIGFYGPLDGSVMITTLPFPLWGLFGKYMFVEYLVILLYQFGIFSKN